MDIIANADIHPAGHVGSSLTAPQLVPDNASLQGTANHVSNMSNNTAHESKRNADDMDIEDVQNVNAPFSAIAPASDAFQLRLRQRARTGVAGES